MMIYTEIHKGPEDDKISIENEGSHITIGNINTIEKINTAQINIDAERGKRATEVPRKSCHMKSNNRYNIRPRPGKGNTKFTMLQNGHQSTMMKLHSPVHMKS